MKEWEASTFGSVKKELASLRRELERVQQQRSLHAGPSREERRILSKISELLTREEIMEKQRSWQDWVKDGDRNTAFYQTKARERAQSNKIASLLLEDGSLVTD